MRSKNAMVIAAAATALALLGFGNSAVGNSAAPATTQHTTTTISGPRLDQCEGQIFACWGQPPK